MFNPPEIKYILVGIACFFLTAMVGIGFGLPVGPTVFVLVIGFAGGIFAHYWRVKEEMEDKTLKGMEKTVEKIGEDLKKIRENTEKKSSTKK